MGRKASGCWSNLHLFDVQLMAHHFLSKKKNNIALKIAFKLILTILFPIHSFTQQPTRIQLSTQKTTKSQIQKQPHLQVALSMEDARHQH